MVASTAAYVTGRLAALVGHASYMTALTIAKSLPGHKKKAPGALVKGALVHASRARACTHCSSAAVAPCVRATAHARTVPSHCAHCCRRHWHLRSGELVSVEERSALHTVGAAGLVAFVEVRRVPMQRPRCVA